MHIARAGNVNRICSSFNIFTDCRPSQWMERAQTSWTDSSSGWPGSPGSCHWLVMLSMEPVLLRQSSPRAKVADASRIELCYPWFIHQPRPPYQTGAMASAGGAIHEGVAYCAMSQFLTLGANGRTLDFRLFVIRVSYEKLGHILKPLVFKFCLDL